MASKYWIGTVEAILVCLSGFNCCSLGIVQADSSGRELCDASRVIFYVCSSDNIHCPSLEKVDKNGHRRFGLNKIKAPILNFVFVCYYIEPHMHLKIFMVACLECRELPDA